MSIGTLEKALVIALNGFNANTYVTIPQTNNNTRFEIGVSKSCKIVVLVSIILKNSPWNKYTAKVFGPIQDNFVFFDGIIAKKARVTKKPPA